LTRGRAASDEAVIIPRHQHPISRSHISANALKVLYRLNKSGYQAYLVGGGVRDLFLGLSPKDFDVATDARPEQVRKAFRNCRLVGRRFRLAHVLFGREIIEVATFRAAPEKSTRHGKQNDQGMLVRDNVYGSMRDDAFRRDFTINALYYCVKDFCVYDYVGGIEDLRKRQLRLIGEPETRYREDPVRMLRAARLSAKLNLKIEKATREPIAKLAELLHHVSAARLWDESSKLFLTGYSVKVWPKLLELNLLKGLLPHTCQFLEDQKTQAFISAALASTDRRVQDDLPVNPAFLFAVFMWPVLQHHIKRFQSDGLGYYDALQKATSRTLEQLRETIAVPRRFALVIREIWSLQARLENRKKRTIVALMEHPRFRAAYDFLCLRASAENELQNIADWWTELQQVDSNKRHKMITALEPGRRRRRPRRRPRGKRNPQQQSAS